MTETRNIPGDILLFHILPRLPVDSLRRFRSVSKGWHSFLKTLMFVNMHNNHVIKGNLQHPPKLVFLSKTTPCEFHTIDCEAPDNGLSVSRLLPFIASGKKFDILTSFHGLVCVSILVRVNYYHYKHADLVLWNPLTSEYKTLSKTNFPIGCLGGYYSSSDDDYKLLNVVSNRCVCMYSLKSDSWRKVEDSSIKSITLNVNYWKQSSWLNGNLYLLNGASGLYSIVKFDTKTEEFTEIATPCLEGRDVKCLTIMVHRGCIVLCVKYNVREFRKTYIQLWSLNGDENWCKVKTYGQLSNEVGDYLEPLHLMKNKKLLMHYPIEENMLIKHGKYESYFEHGKYALS